MKNDMIKAILIGLIIPFVSYAIFLMIFDGLEDAGISQGSSIPMFRQRTSGLLAITANLIPLHYFKKKNSYSGMRGIVIPTFLYIGLWFYFFSSLLF